MTRRSFARRGFLTGDFSIDRDETGLLELLDGDLGTDGPVTFVAANQREVEERARRVSTPFVPWTRGILLYLSLRCQAWSSQGRTAATRPATKLRDPRRSEGRRGRELGLAARIDRSPIPARRHVAVAGGRAPRPLGPNDREQRMVHRSSGLELFVKALERR